MMEHPGFFHRAGPFSLTDLATHLGAELSPAADPETKLSDIRTLADAGPQHLTFFDNRKYLRFLGGQFDIYLLKP